MEMKLPSASYESKRKAQSEESSGANSAFKKARHDWQIKGESSKGNKRQNCDLLPILQRSDPVHVAHSNLQEDAPSSQHINSTVSARAATYENEAENVDDPELSPQGSFSSEKVNTRFNGQNADFYGTIKSKVTGVEGTNKPIETCEHIQRGSNHLVPEFHFADPPGGDLNSESAFFGSSSASVPSNGHRSEYNPHSSTSSSNSNEFNSFLAKRQNSHIAKAVVDNAINKTLEDMGVSPDTNADNFVTGKCNVEDAGISQAIQSQGLIPQHQNLGSQVIVSQHQAVYSATLAPLLSQVPHLSDMVFSERRFQPDCLAETRDIILDPNLSFAHTSGATTVSMSSSDLLDQAVSMAISSQGLALQRDMS
ncbi:uncharacterized protein [Argopecten irradians]|uniref:uncharacterized protein n=1 Tax=Argopecten irradians TaxID=31199 RepID=UPI00371F9818